MKRFIITIVAVAVCAAPAAAAPAKNGPKPVQASKCKPLNIILKGTIGDVAGDSLSLTVSGGNKAGRAITQTVSVSVTAETKISRNDADAVLVDLNAGDLANVQVRLCRGDNVATTELVARRISAHAATVTESV